jgi:hypothetical protein
VHDNPGFYAVGSGCDAAYWMLTYFNQKTDCSISQTIFNVCAAKFMAEKIDGIGKDTFLYVKRFGHGPFSCDGSLLQKIRDAWDGVGAPRVPPEIVQIIEREGRLHWFKLPSP